MRTTRPSKLSCPELREQSLIWPSLCDHHSSITAEDEPHLLLIRDVLHALLVPIVELFDKATWIAGLAEQAKQIEDSDHAYHGDGRCTFLWLQCFLARQREWCHTHGCPACVVEHALDSEFTIRLLYAACLLSDVHYPFTLEGPKLPSFMFFVECMRIATETDSPGFFETVEPSAVQLRNGVEELIHQSLSLESSLSRPATPTVGSVSGTPAHGTQLLDPVESPLGVKMVRNKPAPGHGRPQLDDNKWVEDMMKQTWDHVRLEDDMVLSSISMLSLNDILKTESVVAVQELAEAERQVPARPETSTEVSVRG